MEFLKLLVELIVGIAWPVVVAGILWSFWSYRDQIIAQLSRVTEVGLTSVKLGSPSPAQELTPPPSVGEAIASAHGEAIVRGEGSVGGEAIASPDAAVTIGQIKGGYPPEVLEPALDAIRRDLVRVAKTDAQKIEILVHVVAALRAIPPGRPPECSDGNLAAPGPLN
jgi:hypothetical protein